MTLIQLAYAVALADYGHFGRAAETCFVSQPTLSTQIQKLEDELGVVLFDRSRHPVEPTARGLQVVAQARVVLAQRDALYSMVHEEGPITGTLRIGIIPTVSPYLMPPLAPALAEAYPGIELTVEEQITSRLMDRLRRGKLDAAIVATDESGPDVQVNSLYDEPFMLYVNARHPLARRKRVRLGDINSAEDLWLLSDGHCLRDQIVEWCGNPARTVLANMHFESGSLETLRNLVERVGGMTLLPFMASTFFESGSRAVLKSFSGKQPGRTVRIVQMKGSLQDRLVTAVAAVAREAATDLATATR